jgi:uncharacterized membrane protein YphA (DoxX/SURF4 family)
MLKYLGSISNAGWAIFLVRWIIGLQFLIKGWFKVTEMGLDTHAQQLFATNYADYWMPEILLLAAGYSIPVIELVGGALICAGIWVRESLIAFGLVLIITTYGHLLKEPFFDIDGHTFTYLVMIIFLLLMPSGDDKLRLPNPLAKD